MTMKKIEKILGTLSLISLALILADIPSGAVFSILLISSLSVFYMYLTMPSTLGIPLKKVFKKASYKGLGPLRIIGLLLLGFSLAIVLIGILFKLQSWPGASPILGAGSLGLFIALIVGLIKYKAKMPLYFSEALKRILIIGGVALSLLLIPKASWLEFRYRNHPSYIEAVKEYWENPNDQKIIDKLEQETNQLYED